VLILYDGTASGVSERAIVVGSGGGFGEIARDLDAADGGGAFFQLALPGFVWVA
jgi:hypothetical protein